MIFFDLDGTLVDQSRAERQAAVALWRAVEVFKVLSVDEFVRSWSEVSEELFNQHLKGLLTFDEQRRRRVQEMGTLCQAEISDPQADEIFLKFLTAYEESWCLYSDARPLLEALRSAGKSLGVITNGDAVQQREKLRRVRIDLFFDVIVISGEAKVAKPKPEIFKLAAERAQRSPESCWYIGDRLDIDAEASRAVGFNSVWVNRAKQVATGSPNLLVIDDLGSKALREALGVD